MRNEIPNKIIPFIWFFVKKYKLSFFGYIITILLISEISFFFLSPYLIKLLVDGLTNNTLELKIAILLILAIGYGDLYFPILILMKYLNFNSLIRAIEDIRIKLFTYSLKQSTNFFNSNYSGNLTSKIGTVTSQLNSTIEILLMVLRNFVLLFILIFVMFSINKFFGIILIIWFLCFFKIIHYSVLKISEQSRLNQEIQDNINGFITDDFLNAKNIKVFSSLSREQMKLSKILKKKIKINFKISRYISFLNLFISIVNYTMIFTILVLSLKMLLNKELVLGSFFFIIEICRKIGIFSQYFNIGASDAFKNIAIIKEGLKILDNDIEIKNKKDAPDLKISNGKIIFKNIVFGYKLNKEECI